MVVLITRTLEVNFLFLTTNFTRVDSPYGLIESRLISSDLPPQLHSNALKNLNSAGDL